MRTEGWGSDNSRESDTLKETWDRQEGALTVSKNISVAKFMFQMTCYHVGVNCSHRWNVAVTAFLILTDSHLSELWHPRAQQKHQAEVNNSSHWTWWETNIGFVSNVRWVKSPLPPPFSLSYLDTLVTQQHEFRHWDAWEDAWIVAQQTSCTVTTTGNTNLCQKVKLLKGTH